MRRAKEIEDRLGRETRGCRSRERERLGAESEENIGAESEESLGITDCRLGKSGGYRGRIRERGTPGSGGRRRTSIERREDDGEMLNWRGRERG